MSKLLNALDRLPPYHIVQNFIGNELIERLLAYAIAHETEFAPTKVGKHNKRRLDPKIHVSRVLRDFGPLRTELDARFRAAMPPTITELRLSPFDLADCEIELVAHGDDAFYKRHIDTSVDAPTDKTQPCKVGKQLYRLPTLRG